MEGWLPACDANPIDPTPERMKTAQNVFKGQGMILFRMKNERMIVAIGATEVAVRKEEDRTNLPHPIDKGGLQKTFNLDPHLSLLGGRDFSEPGEDFDAG
jgi:hypothetical protein